MACAFQHSVFRIRRCDACGNQHTRPVDGLEHATYFRTVEEALEYDQRATRMNEIVRS